MTSVADRGKKIMSKQPLPTEITDALDESRRFILACFYKQPLHDIMRVRIPDGIIGPNMAYGLDPWFDITKDHIRRHLIATGMKEDVTALHAAFQTADIETLVGITGWSYHDAWERMAAFTLEGRIRAVDAHRPLEDGDIVKIERPSKLEGKVESRILRVVRIDGEVASVQVIETANVASDCGFVSETLPLSCVKNDWVRNHLKLTVRRLRRKHENGANDRKTSKTGAACLNVTA
jgi:hypothetical protein